MTSAVVGESARAYAASRPRARMRRVLVGVALLDVLVLALAVTVAWELRLTVPVWEKVAVPEAALATTAGPWILTVWILLLAVEGAYSRHLFAAGPDEFRTVFTASLLAAGVVGLGCYLLDIALSRGFLSLAFVLGTPALLVERYTVRKVVHRLRRRGRLLERVVAVGEPSAIREVVSVLHRERYAGYEVVGACIPDGSSDGQALPVSLVGGPKDLERACGRLGASTVLVARGAFGAAADVRRMAWELEKAGLDLVVVPNLTEVAAPRMSLRPVAGLPLLHVEGPRVDRAGGPGKRIFDVLLAAATLLVLTPLMLVLALLIKVHDGGPVFFRQSRIGLEGKRFEIVKFRTMAVDAEQRLSGLRDRNDADGLLFKDRHDPRITRVGRWLRRFSLDELPQLVNVLRGEMSLVGPRPPLPSEVAQYGETVRRRLLVRPGMTGLWQVSGRSDLSWSESVRLDLYYVDNWSMMTDLVIMAKTVRAVVVAQGAY